MNSRLGIALTTGLLLAAFGRWNFLGWHGRETQSITFRAPDDVLLTPAQKVCAWFFFVMAALFVAQTLLGGASEHYRADLQTFFGVSTLISGTVLWWKGILTGGALLMAVPLFAVYGIGLWAGTHGFRLASEEAFRRGAYLVIFLSALISLPLWDVVIGR